MAGDAYTGGGGWSGGSPLGDAQGALGSLGTYMSKIKTYDPQSGGLVSAKPAQPNQQMSSLARTMIQPVEQAATTPVAQPAPQVAPQPVQMVAPVQQVQPAQTVTPAGLTMAQGRNLRSVGGAPADFATAAKAPTLPSAEATFMGTLVRADGSTFTSPVKMVLNPSTGDWDLVPPENGNTSGYDYAMSVAQNREFADRVQPNAKATWSAANNARLEAAAGQRAQDNIDMQTWMQKANADAIARAAQAQAERNGAFSLAGKLQAPDTSAVDRAAAMDLAQLNSQYGASGYGPDAAFRSYMGQRDQGTQANVNQATHNTAYANAFASNYGTFTDALKAQQANDVNASGQRLQYDMQGVDDALKVVVQQSSQLSEGAKTALQSAVLPLQDALAKYQNAVKDFGVKSTAAIQQAQAVLSLAGSLASAPLGIKK